MLLISDDVGRSLRLVRDLGESLSSRIYDLYDENAESGMPDLIVSDVKSLTSEAILRLRRLLERVRQKDVPFLCLLHDNGARTLAHADLLGASATASATAAARHLSRTLADLRDQALAIPLSVQRHADRARKLLCEFFGPERLITPDLADVGTGIVEDAVRENGIRTWVEAVRRFDDATHQHCLLVAGLTSAFATHLGLNAADRHHLGKSALLHDVGKVHVPPSILNKPGKLNATEMATMRTHAAKGHAMLLGQGFDETLMAVVRSHHEMLDGSGYPDGLKGREILDPVRLVTICDVYGALIERRPYRAPMSGGDAWSILDGMEGRLDADLVKAFHPVTFAFHASHRTVS
jgi:putative nucleotidyltransferase with HDIG domain